MIIRGGYNVYPREVEEALYEHPGVLEAAVVGVSDESLGEEVAAIVVRGPAPTIPTARRGRRSAAWRRTLGVVLVAELPRAHGKILKRSIDLGPLRELLAPCPELAARGEYQGS